MSQVHSLWKTASGLPVVGEVVGKRAFSLAFSRKAPYFASIHPRFTVVEPNHVELVIPKRRSVQNHIGTVHAIALCNGLEAAMGALAEVTIPKDKRWIPKGMEVVLHRQGDQRHHLRRRDRPGPVGHRRRRPRRPGQGRARRRNRRHRGRDPALGHAEEQVTQSK